MKHGAFSLSPKDLNVATIEYGVEICKDEGAEAFINC